MKKLLLLVSVSALLFSCDKANDEIEVSKQQRKAKVENYCKNEDHALLKMFIKVEGKSEASIKQEIQFATDLHNKMNKEFRASEDSEGKSLYLKIEPTSFSNEGIHEIMISVHVFDNPEKPYPQTTRTLYTGDEYGSQQFYNHYTWQWLLSEDPCAPVVRFEFEGVWYVEDCC